MNSKRLWEAKRINSGFGQWLIKSFKRDYERDLGVSLGALEQLIALSDEQLCDGIEKTEHSAIASALLPSIEMAQKAKKSPTGYLKTQGKTRLRMWAKSHVADRAVKVLFKKLQFAYKHQ